MAQHTQQDSRPIAVETSNETKILYPESGLTKGDVIAYYERVAERMLPYLQDRPLVVQRFPDGIHNEGFYQKQASKHFPDWIATVDVEVLTTGKRQQLVVCNDGASLIYLANQACLTLHPWLSRRDKLKCPDTLIIDLDPPDADFEAVQSAALKARELFELLKLPCFVNLTGSRGLHLRIPLKPELDFDQTRSFARAAMGWLANRYPDELTTEHGKQDRQGRLYLDVDRNAYAQTAVAPWSLRSLPGAPIAVPISWEDVENKQLTAQDYTLKNVFSRIARRRDPWLEMGHSAVSLEEPKARLDRLWHDPS